MPNATIDPSHFEREDLKTLEGAFVMVRPLPYGLKLKRRDKATKMYMEAPTNVGRNKNETEEEAQRFELETLNEWSTLYDFKYCIGEHNLEDVNGAQLDLGSPMTLQILDPRIGTELETILARLNQDETEEDAELFIKRHTTPTLAEQTM